MSAMFPFQPFEGLGAGASVDLSTKEKDAISANVQAKASVDLEQRLENNDWTLDQGDVEEYAAAVGATAGAAACAAVGAPVLSPLCGAVGGAVASWLAGAVGDVFDSLFGSDDDEEQYQAWLQQQAQTLAELRAGVEKLQATVLPLKAYYAARDARINAVAKLWKLANAAGLGNLTWDDIHALLGVKGARLQHVTSMDQVPGISTWQKSHFGFAQYQGDIHTITMAQAQAYAKSAQSFIESLIPAGQKAAVALIATGAAHAAAEAAAVATRNKQMLAEATATGHAKSNTLNWGLFAAGGALLAGAWWWRRRRRP